MKIINIADKRSLEEIAALKKQLADKEREITGSNVANKKSLEEIAALKKQLADKERELTESNLANKKSLEQLAIVQTLSKAALSEKESQLRQQKQASEKTTRDLQEQLQKLSVSSSSSLTGKIIFLSFFESQY